MDRIDFCIEFNYLLGAFLFNGLKSTILTINI